MEMVINSVGIIVNYGSNKLLKFAFPLDNEESIDVVFGKDVFENVSSTDDVIKRFNDAFEDPWNEGRSFEDFVEWFDYNGLYEKFINSLKSIEFDDINYIGIFNDNALYPDKRQFYWAKYTFRPERKRKSNSAIITEPAGYSVKSKGLSFITKVIKDELPFIG